MHGIIAMIPSVASKVTGITTFQGIGSTSIIIMVGVAIEIGNQIDGLLAGKSFDEVVAGGGN